MEDNRYDVLVVGEGFAGILAAAAAREQGARVGLVSTGPGTFMLAAGTVNAEGMTAETDLGHDGARGNELDEAFNFFSEFVSGADCAYRGGLHATAYLPTALGTFQPASMAPSFAWFDQPGPDDVATVVGVHGLPEINAAFIAEGLTTHAKQLGVPLSYKCKNVHLPWREPKPTSTWEIAHALDGDARCWEQLTEVLRPLASNAKVLIVPGMLGFTTTSEQRAKFEKSLGCQVVEVPTVPPSVLGWRLFRKLDAQLRKSGITIVSGFPVEHIVMEGTGEFRVSLDTPGRQRVLRALAIVLATGGPVREFFSTPGSAPLQEVAGSNRSVDADADPPFLTADSGSMQNLFVAGRALQNCAPGNGNAMAILTGYQSGKRAARQVNYAAQLS